jgi:stage V sporulation protein SpoVS
MENIEEPVNKIVTNDTKKILQNDPRILKARGGDMNNEDPSRRPTDPVGLSRSILHVLKEHEYVRILSVGPTALSSVMAAFRLASREVESLTNGSVLVCRQSEYNAEIAGKKTKGISTRIFAIDIKFAL